MEIEGGFGMGMAVTNNNGTNGLFSLVMFAVEKERKKERRRE